MANILDYIKWRGDLNLVQDEFNDVDNLVLSRFSYFPFESLIKENEVVTIKELSERFIEKDVNTMIILWPDDVNLFPLMGDSKRFGEMYATKYINKIEVDQERQFSAITVLLPDNTIFVSFRGTDNTIVGWKEDFNMSFKSHIASQISAKKYLEEVAAEYPDKKIRIGGHSKGGNIAVYAAAFVNDDIKKRIIKIYSNDGPGFCEDVIKSKEYKDIIERVHTFIPQSSIIGRLMNHEEEFTIVESVQKGIMQHDLFSWQVLGNKFEELEMNTTSSEFIDGTIKKWLERVDPKKREQVIDVVYDIVKKTDAETVKDFKEKWFENSKILLRSYRRLDKETRSEITQAMSNLVGATKDNVIEKIPINRKNKNEKNVDNKDIL